jgi:hypothetical protein
VAKKKTKLSVIPTPDKKATILIVAVTPAFKGDENEDLLCGGCDIVLGESISLDTLYSRFVAPVQFLVVCAKCKAHNRIPVQVGN